MRMPLDTPERRAALRQSPDLMVLRRLARAHGMSLRRLRRVGAPRYTLGIRGATTFEERQQFGLFTLLDDGHLVHAYLFGQDHALPDYLTVSNLMELGPQPDSAPHDTATGPIALVLEATAVAPALEEAAGGVVDLLDIEHPVTTTGIMLPGVTADTLSVPVVALVTLPEVRVSGPPLPDPAYFTPVWKLWTRFIGGLLMIVVMSALFMTAATGVAVPPVVLAMSVLAATLGAPLFIFAILQNDERLALQGLVGRT